MRQVRKTFADLIVTVPGGVQKPSDLQKSLALDQKLSWKILKIVDTEDPLSAAQFMPGTAAIQLFLKAAARQKLPIERIEDANAAADSFEELVNTHAGDRTSFDAMISACCHGAHQRMDLVQKRSAYRANSYLLGIQAGTQLSCQIYCPNADDPTRLDFAGVRGYVGLCGLRPDASWIVSRTRTADDDGVVRQPVIREPIDPAVENQAGISLLTEFCSQPLPKLRSVATNTGYLYGELLSNGVGNTAAFDCMFGDVSYQALSRYRDEHNQFGAICAEIRTPCKVLILDLIVREDTFGPLQPQVEVYSEHGGGPTFVEGGRRHKLDTIESVVYLGRGSSVVHTRDISRYCELCDYIFERLEWDGECFDVYRCRVEYPITPSTVLMRFSLPEPA